MPSCRQLPDGSIEVRLRNGPPMGLISRLQCQLDTPERTVNLATWTGGLGAGPLSFTAVYAPEPEPIKDGAYIVRWLHLHLMTPTETRQVFNIRNGRLVR